MPRPRTKPSATWRVRMLSAGLAALAVSQSCGRVTERSMDSESHFLSSCESSCAEGASCICGVCTLVCSGAADCQRVSPAASCRNVDVAECAGTPAPSSLALTPLAARVCDVACAADADCAELSAEHRCQSGHCRLGATRLELSALTAAEPPGSGSGTEEPLTEPISPAPTVLPASCDQFRDQPLVGGLRVRFRNERSTLIYLQQFVESAGSCLEPFRFAQVERDGMNVDRVGAICSLSCNDLVSSPDAEFSSACVKPACYARSAPLPPGGELSEYIDRAWTTVPLPLECLGHRTPESDVPQCKIAGPLREGRYTLRALAFTEVNPQPTSCTFPETEPFSCFIGVPGTEIRAEGATSSPDGELTLVFSETAGDGPDAGSGPLGP